MAQYQTRDRYFRPDLMRTGQSGRHIRVESSRLSWLFPAEAIFVWCVWASALAATLWLVKNHGSAFIPVGDDLVASLPGILQPFPEAASWVWQAHNEHRVPFPKLVMWGTLNVTKHDFRSVMCLNVACVGLLSLVMVLTAKRIRGRIQWTDAFFPLIAFCWAQVSNFLTNWQIHLMLAMLLEGIIIAMAFRMRRHLTWLQIAVVCACLMLLPLSGASGLVIVPAFVIWIAFETVRSWRVGTALGRRQAVVLFASNLATCILLIVYVLALEMPEDIHSGRIRPKPTVMEYASMGLEVLGSALGPAVYDVLGLYAGGIVAALLFAAVAALGFMAARRPSKRLPAIRAAFCLAAVLSLVTALAWGRAPFGDGVGMQDRYFTVLLPLTCAIYLVWVLFNARFGAVMQGVLFVGALMVFALGAKPALNFAGMFRFGTAAMEQAVLAGKPIPQIAQKWGTVFTAMPSDYVHGFLSTRFRMFRDAGVTEYKHLPDTPPLRAIPFPLSRPPDTTMRASWNAGTCHIFERDPESGEGGVVVFSLPEQRYIWAIRLKLRYPASVARPIIDIHWRCRDTEQGFAEERAAYTIPNSADEQYVTVIVSDTIDQFKIQLADEPCTVYVSEIMLLVPESSETQAF